MFLEKLFNFAIRNIIFEIQSVIKKLIKLQDFTSSFKTNKIAKNLLFFVTTAIADLSEM